MEIPFLTTVKSEAKVDLTQYYGLIIPIFSIVVSVLIILFVVWPKFSETLRLRKTNEQLTARVETLGQKADLLASLDKEELEKQVASAEQLLPSDKSVFSLISQIEKAAGASGVLVKSIDTAPGAFGSKSSATNSSQPGAETPAPAASGQDKAPKITVKLSLTSGYNSFLEFLKNILSISRVTSIEDLGVTSASSEGGTQLNVTFTVNAYWKELPKELGTIESPINKLTSDEIERLKQVEATGLITPPPSLPPSVPLGRTDIFAPF